MKDPANTLPETFLAYRVNPLCQRLGIGRSSLYKLIKAGKIRTVLIAGRRLVPASEVERLMSAGT